MFSVVFHAFEIFFAALHAICFEGIVDSFLIRLPFEHLAVRCSTGYRKKHFHVSGSHLPVINDGFLGLPQTRLIRFDLKIGKGNPFVKISFSFDFKHASLEVTRK